MSEQSFADFLIALRGDAEMLQKYATRNLSQITFHAKNQGFDFTPEDISQVVFALEMAVILQKDGEGVDGNSRLWREMWGTTHLEYLVEKVAGRFTEEELYGLLSQSEDAA